MLMSLLIALGAGIAVVLGAGWLGSRFDAPPRAVEGRRARAVKERSRKRLAE